MKRFIIPLIFGAIAFPVSAVVIVDEDPFPLLLLEKSPIEEFLSIISWGLGALFLLAVFSMLSGLIGFFVTRHAYRKISTNNPQEIVPPFEKPKGILASRIARYAGVLIMFATAVLINSDTYQCDEDYSIPLLSIFLIVGVALLLAGVIWKMWLVRRSLAELKKKAIDPGVLGSEESARRYLTLYYLNRQYKKLFFSSLFFIIIILFLWAILVFDMGEGCGFDVTY